MAGRFALLYSCAVLNFVQQSLTSRLATSRPRTKREQRARATKSLARGPSCGGKTVTLVGAGHVISYNLADF